MQEGVYQELLLERLAQVVGLSAERLKALWSKGQASATPRAACACTGAPRRRAAPAAAASCARPSCGCCIIPAIAAQVSGSERAGLEGSDEPGVALLRELLDNLREHPATLPAQVIQRWAGRDGSDVLQKLLEREEVITSAVAAESELRAALAKLADQAAGRRMEALEAKSRTGTLEAAEIKEFQILIRETQSP